MLRQIESLLVLVFGGLLAGNLCLTGYNWETTGNRQTAMYGFGIMAMAVIIVWVLAGLVDSEEHYRKLRPWLFRLLVTLLVIGPTLVYICLRFQALDPLPYAHDGGVIQTEESARLVLAGTNPYAANFKDTPLRNVGEMGIIVHNPYLPLSFLLPLPFIAAADALNLAYDQRYLYLALYIILLALAPRLFDNRSLAWIFQVLVGLNPLWMSSWFTWGTNDIYLVTATMLVAVCLKQERLDGAALALAAACCLKQFTWVLVPFAGLYLWRARSRPAAVRFLVIVAVFCLLVMLPFFIWSPFDFIDDILLFNAGKSAISYPLGGTPGIGFSMLLTVLGLVRDRYAYFPNIIFIIAFCLPLFIFLLRRLARRPDLELVFIDNGIFTLAVMFFSRVFHINYLVYVMFLISLGVFLALEKNKNVLPHTG